MCGIIGYTGLMDACKILLNGLTQLEYRGYDSAGIAYFDTNLQLHQLKRIGKVENLKREFSKEPLISHCGVGHTRWATHGNVTEANAHPHTAGQVTLIHNGIIENHLQLTDTWELRGKLKSQTDSEVAAWILDHLYHGCPEDAIRELLSCIEGSYAFCILFSDRPGEIYAVRKISPLVASHASTGAFIASDLTALIPYSRNYFVVPEMSIVRMTADKIVLYDLDGKELQPQYQEMSWNTDAALRNGFPHYMLKEIHEQPEALRRTILPRINEGLPDFSNDQIPDCILANCDQVHIIACGTAMHAGMVGKALMEPLLRIPVMVSVASEFRYEEPLIDEHTLVVVISQSGETIDTQAAMRLAKELGAMTLAVVNVKESSIARESDYVFYTHAGPEIAVASTKAYSVQLAALYMLACRMAYVRGNFSRKEAVDFVAKLLDIIPAMECMIGRGDEEKQLVDHLIKQHNTFFIGRGLDYAFSLEGALKLKEISYIHAAAYAAGELKHGTIALIAPGVPVIAIATQEHVYSKMISNVQEVKARGAFIILLTKESAVVDEQLADIHIRIPDMDDAFTVFPIAVILQLIAYYTSLGKNLDVDQPRNLAKSVTVE